VAGKVRGMKLCMLVRLLPDRSSPILVVKGQGLVAIGIAVARWGSRN